VAQPETDAQTPEEGMNPWKNRLVALTLSLLSVSFPIFLVTGYTALYWAWLRGNLAAALPYLPWARNFGMLAMAGAAAALVVLFSSNTFPIPPKIRLALSLLATATIGFFAEFRNDGKFHFKGKRVTQTGFARFAAFLARRAQEPRTYQKGPRYAAHTHTFCPLLGFNTVRKWA